MYQETWLGELATKEKLRNYSEWKFDLTPSPHVQANLPRGKRMLMCRLICGSLQLQVETRRFTGLPRNMRQCCVCNSGEVEDELHFLFECTGYQITRQELYDKLPELLNHSDLSIRLHLLLSAPYIASNFVNKLWQERNLIMNGK